MDDLKIGDFSRPVVSKTAPTKAAPPQQQAPIAQRLDSQEAILDKEASQVEEALTPLQTYEKAIQAIGVTRDRAAQMVDSLLQNGYWSEEVQLSRTVKARFRTRQYKDIERARTYLEITRPAHADLYNDILYKYQLAASLETYNKTTFAFPAKGDSEERITELFNLRLAFVDGLSDMLFRMLLSKLYKFDTKIRVVFDEGAIENF